jgi:hypothetical protein
MQHLFNQESMRIFTSEIANKIFLKINQLSRHSFNNNSVEQVSTQIYNEFELKLPELSENDLYQKAPKDVDIRVNTRGPFTDYRTIEGTRIHIVLPFKGDKRLFSVAPSTMSSNLPYGDVQGSELHFVYEIPNGRDKSEAYEHSKNNVELIKRWLTFMKQDIDAFNKQIKIEIPQVVTSRKEKLDDDTSTANASGIPIR